MSLWLQADGCCNLFKHIAPVHSSVISDSGFGRRMPDKSGYLVSRDVVVVQVAYIGGTSQMAVQHFVNATNVLNFFQVGVISLVGKDGQLEIVLFQYRLGSRKQNGEKGFSCLLALLLNV